MVDLSNIASSSNPPSINGSNLKQIQIPLPALDIQKEIVRKCSALDNKLQESKRKVEVLKAEIEEIFEHLFNNSINKVRLSDSSIFKLSIGKRVLNSEVSDEYDIPVYSANVFEPFGNINNLLIDDFRQASVIWGIDGDWMVNTLDKEYKFYPTDHCGVLRIEKSKYSVEKYIAYALQKVGKESGFSRSYRASIDRISALSIPIPEYNEQVQAVEKVNKIEQQISKLKSEIEKIPTMKKSILEDALIEKSSIEINSSKEFKTSDFAPLPQAAEEEVKFGK